MENEPNKTYNHDIFTISDGVEICKWIEINEKRFDLKEIAFAIVKNECETYLTVNGIVSDFELGVVKLKSLFAEMDVYLYEIHKNFELMTTEFKFRYITAGSLWEIRIAEDGK